MNWNHGSLGVGIVSVLFLFLGMKKTFRFQTVHCPLSLKSHGAAGRVEVGTLPTLGSFARSAVFSRFLGSFNVKAAAAAAQSNLKSEDIQRISWYSL